MLTLKEADVVPVQLDGEVGARCLLVQWPTRPRRPWPLLDPTVAQLLLRVWMGELSPTARAVAPTLMCVYGKDGKSQWLMLTMFLDRVSLDICEWPWQMARKLISNQSSQARLSDPSMAKMQRKLNWSEFIRKPNSYTRTVWYFFLLELSALMRLFWATDSFTH